MRNVFLIMVLLASARTYAQDIIVKSDGDEVQAKVIGVEEDKVSYKKWSNPDGPTYTVGTDKIFMIKYQNGEKDVFGGSKNKEAGSVTSVARDNVGTGYIKKKPDANNAALIKKYNPEVQFNLKPKNGKSKQFFTVMGMEESSVLSNGDVEMRIVRKAPNAQYDWFVLRYYIEIYNKTDGIIYIDKGNSFRSVNGNAVPFYDTKQVSMTSGGGSGVSVGLGSIAGALGVDGILGQIAGGVSVGGGTSSSVSTTYAQQRVVAIPPHGSVYMSEAKWTSNNKEQISEAEEFHISYKGSPVRKGHVVEFNVDNSPCKYKYFITYSTTSDFKNYSTVNADLYAKYVVGCGTLTDFALWKSYFFRSVYKKPEEINKLYNKVIPNFEAEPSMLVGETYMQ